MGVKAVKLCTDTGMDSSLENTKNWAWLRFQIPNDFINVKKVIYSLLGGNFKFQMNELEQIRLNIAIKLKIS